MRDDSICSKIILPWLHGISCAAAIPEQGGGAVPRLPAMDLRYLVDRFLKTRSSMLLNGPGVAIGGKLPKAKKDETIIGQ